MLLYSTAPQISIIQQRAILPEILKFWSQKLFEIRFKFMLQKMTTILNTKSSLILNSLKAKKCIVLQQLFEIAKYGKVRSQSPLHPTAEGFPPNTAKH